MDASVRDSYFTVTYTDAIVRGAVRAFVWRRVIVAQKGAWTAGAGLFVLMVVLLATGDRSWLVGLVGAVSLLPFALLALVWWAHFDMTVGKFHRMARPTAEIAFADSGIAIASDLGHGEIPWTSVVEVWERPQFWMVFLGRAQFNVLPLADIPEPAKALFREKTAHAHWCS